MCMYMDTLVYQARVAACPRGSLRQGIHAMSLLVGILCVPGINRPTRTPPPHHQGYLDTYSLPYRRPPQD